MPLWPDRLDPGLLWHCNQAEWQTSDSANIPPRLMLQVSVPIGIFEISRFRDDAGFVESIQYGEQKLPVGELYSPAVSCKTVLQFL